jgi:hypothetical protein
VQDTADSDSEEEEERQAAPAGEVLGMMAQLGQSTVLEQGSVIHRACKQAEGTVPDLLPFEKEEGVPKFRCVCLQPRALTAHKPPLPTAHRGVRSSLSRPALQLRQRALSP